MDKTASQRLIVKVAANIAGTAAGVGVKTAGDLLDRIDNTIYNKKSPVYKGMQRLGEMAYDNIAGKPDYSASPEVRQMWDAAYKRQTVPRKYYQLKSDIKTISDQAARAGKGAINAIKQYKWW